MKYQKPNVSAVFCEVLDSKLQGTGQALLVCSGQVCGENLGTSCQYVMSPIYFNYIDIKFFQEGVPCAVTASVEGSYKGSLSSCVVTAISINGEPVQSDFGLHCRIVDSVQCDSGCSLEIQCDSSIWCNSMGGQTIEATVSCSGTDQSVNCTNS